MNPLVYVGPDEIIGFCEQRVRELLGPLETRSRGRTSLNEIVDQARKKECQIWAVFGDGHMTSAVVTRVVVYEASGRTIFRIDFAGGRLEDAVAYMPQLELLAEAAGCDAMRIEGRAGWKRIFPDWQEVSRVIEKEVSHGRR